MAKNIHDADTAPTIKNPTLILDNRKWKLNPAGEAYVAYADIGSRKHPHIITIPVTKQVGDLVSDHHQGELWIGATTFTITYSKDAPPGNGPPRDKPSVGEMKSGINYVGGEPKPILAADMNAWGVMVGDNETMIKFNLADRVQQVYQAKIDNTPQDERRKRENIRRYERRKGRKISNKKVDEKRAKRIVKQGGKRKIHKDGRDIRRLKKAKKSELQQMTNELRRETKGMTEAEKKPIKEEYAIRRKAVKKERDAEIGRIRGERKRRQRVVDGTPNVDNKAKQAKVTKAVKSLDHAMHVVAVLITMLAAERGAILVLEGLTGMAGGWTRQGRFGKPLRRKLHSAAMMKLQGYIRYKAEWLGVSVLDFDPRNTSAWCCRCRCRLSGIDYAYRTCTGCVIRVNRDVNAVLNLWRTTAAALYGRVVRPSRDEAQREPDVILCSGELVRGGRSLRVDRKVGMQAWPGS